MIKFRGYTPTMFWPHKQIELELQLELQVPPTTTPGCSVIHGDCITEMAAMAPNSVDAIVCDPPYGLRFMGKAWDDAGEGTAQQAWHEAWAREALRVLKPGGHLVAFGGSRTYHRLTCALEDVGFEIRDSLMWLYGTGFPKSLNVGNAVDAHRNDGKSDSNEWNGWGTALKPAHEPVVLARKPLDGTVAKNILKWGTGALNIDACRIATTDPLGGGAYAKAPKGRHDGSENWRFKGGGAGEYQQPTGRWPANVVLSPEGAAELDAQSAGDSGGASRFFYCAKPSQAERNAHTDHLVKGKQDETREDGAPGGNNPRNRGAAERGNNHPTVKPLALMRWLIRLVTPKGGLVLDPFLGSGSTGLAAMAEGVRFVGIEKEAEYMAIARARLQLDAAHPQF